MDYNQTLAGLYRRIIRQKTQELCQFIEAIAEEFDEEKEPEDAEECYDLASDFEQLWADR